MSLNKSNETLLFSPGRGIAGNQCVIQQTFFFYKSLAHNIPFDVYLGINGDDTKTSQTVRISHLDTHTEQISLLNVKHENFFFIT